MPELIKPAVEPAKSTSLVAVSASLSEFERVQAGIAGLKAKYERVVYDVTTTKGMAEAKAARVEIRDFRYAAQNAAKAAKSELASISKNIGEKAEQIIAPLQELEDPIDQMIKGEEERKGRERQEKLLAEAARLRDIREKISRYAAMVDDVAGKASADIAEVERHLSFHAAFSDESLRDDLGFAEFAHEAKHFIAKALERCSKLREQAQAAEDEAARLAAERAELERLRAAAAAREEADRRARAEAEAAARAEQERVAAELARQQEALDAARRAQEEELAAARRAEEERAAAARAEAARREEEERAAARAEIERQRAEAQRVIDEANRIAAEKRAAEDARLAAEAAARREAEIAERARKDAEEAAAAAERAEAERLEAERRAAEQAKLDKVCAAGPKLLAALRTVRNSGLWEHATDHVKSVVVEALTAAGEQ